MAATYLQTTETVHVTVTGSDYTYSGTLAGIAIKRNGEIRYVVEADDGSLFVHSAKQLGKDEGWLPT
jgi:hypothetical protein